MKKTIKHVSKIFHSLCIIPSICIIVFQSCTGANSKDAATIGQGGNMNEIIIPANSDSIIKFAAVELQGYLKKITGKALPVS